LPALKYCDSSPAGWTAANPNGRLVSVSCSAGSGARSFTEYYSYTPAGLAGFRKVKNMKGGILAGSDKVDPRVPKLSTEANIVCFLDGTFGVAPASDYTCAAAPRLIEPIGH